MDEEKYIGYLKYSGKLVEEGLLDAKKSAQALLGFDGAIRFFVDQQAPHLTKVDYEFPVRVRQGTWEVLIPKTIGQWIMAGGGIVVTTYLSTAAKKMAEKDFDDVGIRDIFSKALKAIQWVIKIGKHIGNTTKKKFESVKFRNDNQEIGIPNEEGEILFVPKEFFDLYTASNPLLLSKLAKIVEEERVLSIGVYEDGKPKEEDLPRRFRYIFTQEEKEIDDQLFPELKHGQQVELEGIVTRGNVMTNTIGFQYKGHILMAYPEEGSIARFKPSLFLRAIIHGTISRLDDSEEITAKKPKIIFTDIEPLNSEPSNRSLFGDS